MPRVRGVARRGGVPLQRVRWRRPEGGGAARAAAPLTTGIAFVFWGSFKGVSVGSEWTKRSSLDGDYIGDRAIRAGTSLVMGATCAGDCVMLGGVFAR
ncbi:MAG: hypothetical protein U0270_17270 [Labilithrix sp.]